MIDKELLKHAREFQGHIRSHRYEVSDEGILFPTAGAMIQGEYFFDTNDGERPGSQRNTVPVQTLNYFLETGLRGGAAASQFYLALYSGAYTPASTLTAALFPAAATEITSATEGYTEGTRRPWMPEAAVGGTMANMANRAAFTIATASEVTIRGAALLSDSVKGGTNGVIASIVRFASDRKEAAGDVFNLAFRVRISPE